MKKLDTNTRTYFKNFFQYLIMVTVAIFIFSVNSDLYPPNERFDLQQGLFIVSILCIFGCGHLISMKFVDSERFEECKKKNSLW